MGKSIKHIVQKIQYRWYVGCNDVGAAVGAYKYPHANLFIAGLPKSGTTWLWQMIGRVPGYSMREPSDPAGITARHDVDDGIFAQLPSRGYSVLKLHTRWSPQNEEVLQRWSLKPIVIYRDPRDVAVSRYYDIVQKIGHPDQETYAVLSKEEGIDHSLSVVAEHFLEWIEDWLRFSEEHPEDCTVIRYEELRSEPVSVLANLLAEYGITLEQKTIERIVASCRLDTGGLKKHYTQGTASLLDRSTGRKGAVEGWREELTKDQSDRISSSWRDSLIRFGYDPT